MEQKIREKRRKRVEDQTTSSWCRDNDMAWLRWRRWIVPKSTECMALMTVEPTNVQILSESASDLRGKIKIMKRLVRGRAWWNDFYVADLWGINGWRLEVGEERMKRWKFWFKLGGWACGWWRGGMEWRRKRIVGQSWDVRKWDHRLWIKLRMEAMVRIPGSVSIQMREEEFMVSLTITRERWLNWF
jgi:hypothetical protein